MDPKQKRTITLTGRRPVRILDADWPVLARAAGDSYGSTDPQRHDQAISRGECDEYWLTVRRHVDLRVPQYIVYGVTDAATVWTGNKSHRGGEMLTQGTVTDAMVAAAIRRVGEECHLPDEVIRECLADLPAEEL